jgi:hypothetical protein
VLNQQFPIGDEVEDCLLQMEAAHRAEANKKLERKMAMTLFVGVLLIVGAAALIGWWFVPVNPY